MKCKMLVGTIGLLVGIVALACESETQSQVAAPEAASAEMTARGKAKDLLFFTRYDSLMIFDVSDLESITLVSSVPVGRPLEIERRGSAVYMLVDFGCERCRKVVIVDITNPSDPKVMDFLEFDPSSEAETVIRNVQVVGKLLFVTIHHQEEYEDGLLIYDISFPLNPVQIATG